MEKRRIYIKHKACGSQNYLWRLAVSTFIFLCVVVSMHAQVTIGGDTPPKDFSIMEILSNEEGGLRMPLLTTEDRDAMQATDEFQTYKGTLAKGLTIYNTTVDCLEFWNGEQWVSTCLGEACEGAPTVTISSNLHPAKVTMGSRVVLTANAVGGRAFTYKWYKNGTLIADATEKTYTIESSEYGVKYTVETNNDCGTAKTDWISCGAKTTDGGWLTFMCHNLGVDQSLDPFTPNIALYGDLYQWGQNDTDWISNRYGDDTAWGDGIWGTSVTADPPKGPKDPCPPGWKVPSYQQWLSIYTDMTTPNTWTWVTANKGYMVGEGLFLPAGGFRTHLGVYADSGVVGTYWNTTLTSSKSVFLLTFVSDRVLLGNCTRDTARSVRCVAE